MAKELNTSPNIEEVKKQLKTNIAKVFEVDTMLTFNFIWLSGYLQPVFDIFFYLYAPKKINFL